MNVSSVKNLNGETFSAVQDADLTTVVQTNSASWGSGSTPSYDYTDNNLISAIDTSGLFAQGLLSGSNIGRNIVWDGVGTATTGNQMWLNPDKTHFAITSGIFSPLYYATGATITYGSSGSPAPNDGQIFGGFLKGNEWYVSNATAGQALRGETHQSRGVHISGATTAGTRFDLSVNCVSGKNSTGDYNWKLERGCVSGKNSVGEWRYGPAEDTALRTASAWNDTIDVVQSNSSTWGQGGSFPVSADEAVQYVQTNSAGIDETVNSVNTNSGAWGGSALPISAGAGINIQLVNNVLIISTAANV